MNACKTSISVYVVVVVLAGAAAAVNIDTVPVGDPGNAPDTRYATPGYGSVSYKYYVGKYEVTAGQYTAFLNAVGGVDTYALYNTNSAITRSGDGTVGSPFTYSVAPDFANRPVNWVSFWNACRFANWLHNGQPTGVQGVGTTETGAYTLTIDGMNNNTVVRSVNGKWAVTSEDEWHKAAYFKSGSADAGYFDYPSSSDTDPGRDMLDASGNNANYFGTPCPIDSGHYTTLAGEFQNSASPYGTFDQGGNLWEWNETILDSSSRGLRGGSYYSGVSDLRAASRSNGPNPSSAGENVGFRVVLILDPADFDGDGDVDSSDSHLFVLCASGPAIPNTPGCSDRDLDADGDVDQDDFGIFQRRYRPSRPGALSVADSDGFASTGNRGGPFTPISKTYTLTNPGGSPIAWTAVNSQTWTTLSKTGGTLGVGGSDTLQISINAGANSLAVGSYGDTVTFTNTTNHNGDSTRVVALTVNVVVPPGMALVPAGQFQMGNSFDPGEGYSDELPRHTVYVDAFYMDCTEVTNQQYADGLNWALGQGNLIHATADGVYNGGYSNILCDTTTSSSYSRITWNGSMFGVVSGKANHPVVQVSWYGAAAYANWRSAMQGRPLCYDPSTWDCNWGSGYRLPTEAEWEKAARGGAVGRRFAWSGSDLISHTWANYYSSSNYWYDNSPTRGYHPTFKTGTRPYTSPVAYFAANGYGLYDMTGNVWEWCNDCYGGAYGSGPDNNPRGPACPASGSWRIYRGGSWSTTPIYCRVAFRFNVTSYFPGRRYDDGGFRLALDSE